ncbi:ATP-dependent DNA ligase [Sphingomonas sp.]|jgi:ATP-dependent DNA ligase|uniref:ATP-dependent DNA ligase n=1 Tax=Sphingomonas sp. TaxID=28214 RepID=UPI002DF44490|nr:ATP-dependent DNA ligase [Sphingomonas sp.]HEV2568419.1 ATP-dependent DNA ligase [Sphingomonas sp.]
MDAIAPMEAKLVEALPEDEGWQFEPKWDGFRCIALRDGGKVELISKSGKSLARYFPEVAAMLQSLTPKRFILDGELIIPVGDCLSFEALQLRLHPAESRIRKLANDTPAQFMLFDLLALGDEMLAAEPLSVRRQTLERFHAAHGDAALLLSPTTVERAQADAWLARTGGALDGVIVKRLDEPYRPGERAMLKVKQLRTADCVVGGFRYASGKKEAGSLLLGLFGEDGKLHHVGFCPPPGDKAELTARLEALVEPPGFTGDAPGGPSRWSTERSGDWQPLRWELIAEVKYDQVTGRRFRHATRFLRWRPDKAPEQCRIEQQVGELRPAELAGLL